MSQTMSTVIPAIESINAAMRKIEARIRKNVAALNLLRETVPEVESRRKHRCAIEHERIVGMTFVAAEADRVWRELGLPTHPYRESPLGDEWCDHGYSIGNRCRAPRGAHP